MINTEVDVRKIIRKRSILLGFGIVFLPLFMIAPFATITGYFTVQELLQTLINPKSYIILGVPLVIYFIFYYFIDKHTFSGNNNKHDGVVARNGFNQHIMLSVVMIILMGFVGIIFTRTVADIGNIFPYNDVILWFLLFCFELMVVLPIFSFLISSQEQYLMEVCKEQRVWIGLKLKLWIFVGGVFVGTIGFIGVCNIISYLTQYVGRNPPFGFIPVNLISIFVGLIMLCLLMNQLMSYIIKPLKLMIDGFLQGVEGDFRVVLSTTTTDEIGIVSRSANVFFDSMRTQIGTLKNIISFLMDMKNMLGDKVLDMSSAITQIQNNADSTSHQIMDQASSVEETAASVEELTRNIDSLNTMVGQQSVKLDLSGNVINNIQISATSVGESSNKALVHSKEVVTLSTQSSESLIKMIKIIKQISEKSEYLSDVIKLIGNISSQTSLLAMNASIEASHAGIFGKGFAVIAEEIRKLAEQSSEQTDRISISLKEIIGFIDSASKESGWIVGYSENLKKGIEINFSFLVEMQEFVKKNTDESIVLSNTNTDLINIMKTVRQGSNEMQLGNTEIIQAITNLRIISDTISNSMKEVSRSIEVISNTSLELNNKYKQIDDIGYKLNDIISKYQI